LIVSVFILYTMRVTDVNLKNWIQILFRSEYHVWNYYHLDLYLKTLSYIYLKKF